uniref:hypothetical protein n=1 Tax=Caballeronia humi TaxID=326474 RepID=UPI001F1A433F|nr:hypothetical protein [Caballeronia humi]
MHLPDDVTLATRANVAVITTLSSQIEVVEKRLHEKVALDPDYALLTTVPGIGQTLATVILLEALLTASPTLVISHPIRAAWTASA